MTVTRDQAIAVIEKLAPTPMLIAGEFVGGKGSGELTISDPARDSTIIAVQSASTDQLGQAVTAASAAQREWENVSPTDRAATLHRLADAIETCADQFTAVITTQLGSPVGLSERLHVRLAVADIRAVAEALVSMKFEQQIGASMVLERAAGVVFAITPWNYPLHQVVAKVAPAIAAGCSVILKPSEEALGAAALFARCVQESGLPAGVLNVVVGGGREIANELVGHPGIDVVSFTGSTEVGSAIARQAAGTITRVHLELGGKSPSLIAPSGDLTTGVKVTLANCFLNSGQSCNALTRLLVPRENLSQVEQQILGLMPRHQPVDPWSNGARMGSVVSVARQASIWSDIQAAKDRGDTILAGGTGLPDGIERGAFVRPTVFFDTDPNSPIAQEEVFGPVLTVLAYDDLNHALELANATRYGLGGSVWASTNHEAADIAREIRSGQVDLNGGAFNPAAPFGGFKASGYGRELGRYGIASFIEPQSLQN
ncbi:aldehyde dehydrogenase family protein [Arthrobacter sp. AQ5-05]|nr:aldehyde dehydrogenase family protein [Arthrobacter sp. AQ5-05]